MQTWALNYCLINIHISVTSNSIPSITEDTAREAFVLYASSKCCYSKAPAKDGVITNMDAFNTYRVRQWQFKKVNLFILAERISFYCYFSLVHPFFCSTAWKPSPKQDVQSGVMSLTKVKYS